MQYKGFTINSSVTGEYKCEINPAVVLCSDSKERVKCLIDGIINLNPKLLQKHVLINQKIRGR